MTDSEKRILIKAAAEAVNKITPRHEWLFEPENEDAILKTGFDHCYQERIKVPSGGLTLGDGDEIIPIADPEDLVGYEEEQADIVNYLELVSPKIVLDLLSQIERLEKDLAWARRDEEIVTFSNYMNECCPVRLHQREGGETISENEILCRHETCMYGDWLAQYGFCTADNPEPRNASCPQWTQICPTCQGVGYIERTVEK